MTFKTSLPLRATAGSRCARVAALVVAMLALGCWSAGIAQAAPSSFTLSPGSGPPGTNVSISGTGCAPLPLPSPSNVVAVTAPALGVALQVPVQANGSWHGTFVVPPGSNPGPSPVAAACVPSFATVYTPQMFTVTAPSTTTTRPTTTTTPSSGTTPGTSPGTTTPKPGGGASTPTTGGGPPEPGVGSNPTTTVPTAEGVPPGGSNGGANGGGAGAGPSAPGTRPGTTDVGRATRRLAARAADLRAPELPIAKLSGSSTLGWLAWTLLLALVIGAVATPLWLRRLRRRNVETAAMGEAL